MTLVDYLNNSENVKSAAQVGSAVTARVNHIPDMTAFNRIVTEYGYVPMGIHWEDRRIWFFPVSEVLG